MCHGSNTTTNFVDEFETLSSPDTRRFDSHRHEVNTWDDVVVIIIIIIIIQTWWMKPRGKYKRSPGSKMASKTGGFVNSPSEKFAGIIDTTRQAR